MELEEVERGGLKVWHSPSWTLAGFEHGFVGADLDVKRFPENEATQSFAEVIGVRELCWLDQVHGVLLATKNQALDSSIPKADGWLLSSRDPQDPPKLYAMRTADCFPVIIRDSNSGNSALLHCGWRGTVGGILTEALSALSKQSATDFEIVIGPGASACCYEVNKATADEFALALEKIFPQAENTSGDYQSILSEIVIPIDSSNSSEPKFFCNIVRLLGLQAEALGVSAQNIKHIDICTIESKGFFSFRRQKEQAGRQLSYIVA